MQDYNMKILINAFIRTLELRAFIALNQNQYLSFKWKESEINLAAIIQYE